MKILGIVMEANPFHNGHKYFIEQCKKQIDPNIIIAITSTSFTMRGEISLLNKYDKTKILLEHNVDIVLELPFSQSVQSADYFSMNSILNLNNIGITDLAFGCEIDDINLLYKFVDIITSNEFNEIYKNNKNNSISSKVLYNNILKEFLTDDEIEIFNQPNITLAIQYLKTIKENNLQITPHVIKRVISHYNDKQIKDEFASATAIREAIIHEQNFDNTLPESSYNSIIDYKTAKNKYLDLIKFNFLVNDNISKSSNDKEGLFNYIKKNADFSSYELFQNSLKNKKYTINRINRSVLYSLLNITKIPSYTPYIRILGISDKGLSYINNVNQECKDIIFSGTKELKKMNDLTNEINRIELMATKLYSIITNNSELIKKESMLPIKKG